MWKCCKLSNITIWSYKSKKKQKLNHFTFILYVYELNFASCDLRNEKFKVKILFVLRSANPCGKKQKVKKSKTNQKKNKKIFGILVKYDNFFKSLLGKLYYIILLKLCYIIYLTLFKIMTYETFWIIFRTFFLCVLAPINRS